MIYPRGKALFPNLTRYLTDVVAKDRARKGHEAGTVVAWAFSLAVALIMLSLLALPGFHTLYGYLACTLSLVPFGFLTRAWVRELKKPMTEEERMHQAAADLGHAMLYSKRLHKEIDASAAQLLEESARLRLEIGAVFNSLAWTDKDLPAHWQNIRRQTEAASDQAMDELLLILQSSFVPGDRKWRFENVMEDFIETFTGPKPMRSAHLPPGYNQARDIAEKLKLTLGEITRATGQLMQGPVEGGAKRASAVLDSAINDIRSVQAAESELRQNLRG